MTPHPRNLLWLSAGILCAQDPQGGFGDLKTLLELRNTPVISASKREQNLLDSPQAIEVITGDEIRASGVFRLVDLLKLATGVQVWDEVPSRANVTIRGLNPLATPRTLQVLVDGVPLFNLMAAPLDFNGLPVPLDAIDRVEIVRGPSSSLYGANAQMGVISIFTKRAQSGFEGSARVGAADHGTFRGELFIAQGGPTFSLTVAGAAASSRNFGKPLTIIGRPGATLPFNTASREQQFFLRPEWRFTDGKLWAAFGYGDTGHFDEVNTDPATLAELTFLPDQFIRREIAQVGWAQAWSPLLHSEFHLQQKVFRLASQALESLPNNGTSAAIWNLLIGMDPAFRAKRDFYRDQIQEATWQMTWSPHPATHFVLGANTTEIQTIPNLTLGLPEARTEHASGGFISADWDVAAFTFSGGARAEHETLGGSRVSPRLSALWHADATSSWRLGYFTSTRSPTIQERYSAIPSIPIITYLSVPNPAIRPEEAASVELGYRRFGERWSLDVTLFQTTLRHLIAQRPTGNTAGGKPIQQWQNNPKIIRDRGLELSLQGQVAPAWRVGFNVATADLKDPIDDLDQQADYAPRIMANLWTRWRRGAWTAYGALQHKGTYTAATPAVNGSLRNEIPSQTQLQFNLGWCPYRELNLSLYGINATHPTQDSAPLALSNIYALRYARRELGIQLAWRH